MAVTPRMRCVSRNAQMFEQEITKKRSHLA